jgi:hypothetical protein
MFFWHKRSTITLDCFTYLESIALNYPIARAGKFYPEELNDIPKTITKKLSSNPHSNITTDILTIKNCNGLSDLYRNGIVIPAWDSFDIEVLGENNFLINNLSGTVKCEHHFRHQYNNEIYKGYGHVKFISPWYIKETTGVKFVWMHPIWNRSDNVSDISILPAILDYKKQHSTNVNAFIKLGKIVSYNAGDPLAHMIPMSEKKIKINIHVLSTEEWMKEKIQIEHYAQLPNHRNLVTPNFLNTKKKCPFGF